MTAGRPLFALLFACGLAACDGCRDGGPPADDDGDDAATALWSLADLADVTGDGREDAIVHTDAAVGLIDLASGELAWTARLPGAGHDETVFEAAARAVWVLTEEAFVRIDGPTGEAKALETDDLRRRLPLVRGEFVVLDSGRRELREIYSGSGEHLGRWAVDLPGFWGEGDIGFVLEDGELTRLEADGQATWTVALPATDAPGWALEDVRVAPEQTFAWGTHRGGAWAAEVTAEGELESVRVADLPGDLFAWGHPPPVHYREGRSASRDKVITRVGESLEVSWQVRLEDWNLEAMPARTRTTLHSFGDDRRHGVFLFLRDGLDALPNRLIAFDDRSGDVHGIVDLPEDARTLEAHASIGVVRGGDPATLAVYDPATGQTMWTIPIDDQASAKARGNRYLVARLQDPGAVVEAYESSDQPVWSAEIEDVQGLGFSLRTPDDDLVRVGEQILAYVKAGGNELVTIDLETGGEAGVSLPAP